MGGKPKLPFYIVVALVVAGLVWLAVRNWGNIAPQGNNNGGQQAGGNGGGPEPPIRPEDLGQNAEAHDTATITTVREYNYVPSQKLPPPQGTSDYTLTDNTVRMALNVWAGWGPIILANEGFQPGKVWKTPEGEEFKLELVLIDNPVVMRDAYANGDVQIGWATLDMLPLFMEGFVDATGKPVDSRVMPRVYQQVDWSNGGDGIVVRADIQTVGDLRGKKLVLAQNSPSHYFALNMLVAGGVQPGEVTIVPTEDAFQAAAAFNAERELAGAVSWAPDIYNLSEAAGNRMLVTTLTANKLIADVWFARADFATDHPGMVEALVRGIFDGMIALKDQAQQQHCAELMAAGYNIPASDTLKMFADAHNTNWAENYQFFLNQNNPANFERVWSNSYYLYRRVGQISKPQVPFDQVMDFTYIQKLGQEEPYRSQTDEYRVQFVPKAVSEIRAEQDEVLTNTVVIHFFPNSWDLHKMIVKDENGQTLEELYDPNVDNVLKEISQIAGQFGAAHIVIEGHTDTSMQGMVPEQLVKQLSENRANAVKEALVSAFNFDPNQFTAVGMGWDVPADPSDPDNHARNRRVEIKVYAAEAQ